MAEIVEHDGRQYRVVSLEAVSRVSGGCLTAPRSTFEADDMRRAVDRKFGNRPQRPMVPVGNGPAPRRNERIARNKAVYILGRKCAACGKELIPHPGGEQVAAFNRRKTCDNVCKITLRLGHAPEPIPEGRICPACGGVLVRNEGERLSDFRRRKHCNHVCANIIQRRKQLQRRLM
jgi:rRNA maturation protein Nop10